MTFNTKRVTAMLLVAIMAMTFMMPVVLAKPDKIPPGHLKGKAYWKVSFSDIDETLEWANLAIDKLYAKGVFTGYPGGIFKPKNNVTHMEAIIMALRVMGWEEEAKNTKAISKDLKNIKLPWDEAYYYVALAVEKGLIKPEELRGFNPNTPAKRYEVARYIVRAIGEEKEAQRHMKEKLPFKDVNAIPREAVGYVYVMVDLGLMVGDSNNKFKPQEPINRAEMAVMLNRLDDSLENEDKDKLVGAIKDIDLKKLTITIQNSFGTKIYDVKEDTVVYSNKKYRDLEDLRIGDRVELVLDKNGIVIFIQTIEKTDRVTTTKKGIVVDANDSRNTISLFSNGKDLQKGFYGTLRVSNIEGRHYELDTEKGRFVLTGNSRTLRGLEDYEGEKIVVTGELSGDVSIYMRGPIIEVENFYDVKTKQIEKYDVDKNTKIFFDGKTKYSLSDIEIGDYAVIKAEDGLALEIKVESIEEPEKVTISAKGLVAEINERKKTLSLATYIKNEGEGFIGILKENDIEGLHYELETEQGTFVLIGETRGLKDYIGKSIIIKGTLKDEDSYFMRGLLLDVEDFYPVRTRDFVTFEIDENTKISIDGVRARLSGIEPGDFAEVKAYKDGVAKEVNVKNSKKIIEEIDKNKNRDKDNGKSLRNGEIEGKVVSINSKNQLTIENKNGRYTLTIANKVKLDGLKKITDIKRGMELELEIRNGKIVVIELED